MTVAYIPKHRLGFRIYLALNALLGIGVIGWLLTQQSEESHAVIGRFTYVDIGLIAITGIIIIALALTSALLSSQRFLSKIDIYILNDRRWWIRPAIISLTIVIAELFVSTVVLQTEIFGLKQFSVVLGWILIITIGFLWFISRNNQSGLNQEQGQKRKASLLIWLPALVFAISGYSLTILLSRFSRFGYIFFCLACLFIIWLTKGIFSNWLETRRRERSLQTLAECLSVFFVAYIVYRSTSILVGNIYTPAKSYFDELAKAVLNGKLFLENPSSTLDLTFFDGKWYLAFPPLPLLFMIPLIAIFPNIEINTVVFTVFWGSINVSIIYLILKTLVKNGWVNLSLPKLMSLLTLFSFGTLHWYMAIVGKVWYVDRILGLTFFLLASLMVLNKRPPILIGLLLLVSILARPNNILGIPFLFFIFLQQSTIKSKKDLHSSLVWLSLVVVPALAGEGILLIYNFLRFGDFVNFGYSTMNIGEGEEILAKFGQFNLLFVGKNLYDMWLAMPYRSADCHNHFVPNPQGVSMLVTTPGLLLLVKSFSKRVWIVGSWFGLLIMMFFLCMHTGIVWEFGYRYMLDLLPPLVLLIAYAADRVKLGTIVLLTILSVLPSIWGILWYFGYSCN